MARPKGSKNKVTRDLKTVFLDSFNDLQKDRYTNLTAWAKKNPEKFYPLAARLIPVEHTGNADNPIQHNHTVTMYLPDNGRTRPQQTVNVVAQNVQVQGPHLALPQGRPLLRPRPIKGVTA